mgnify:CR=1 FL=1
MVSPIREIADFAPLNIPRGRVATLVKDIRADIVSGAIPPGATLVQEDLAARFQVSRMPVREAIKHLQMLGFVTVEDNKRARVAALSVEDFVEIFDMRESAEALAIRSAIPHLSNAHISEAAEIQQQIEAIDPKGFGSLNMAFHMALYRPSARPRLLAHVETLFNAADRYVSMVSAGPDLKAKANAEHHQLLDYCLKRDVAAAEACVRAHVSQARNALAHFF